MEYSTPKKYKNIARFSLISIFIFISWFVLRQIANDSGAYIYLISYFPFAVLLLITESLYTTVKIEENNIKCQSLFKINKTIIIPIESIERITSKKISMGGKAPSVKLKVFFIYFNKKYITIDGNLENILVLFNLLKEKNSKIIFEN